MQDLLSLLVCSNEKTGLQVGIWYKIIFWHELCVRRCLILHVFFVVDKRHISGNFHVQFSSQQMVWQQFEKIENQNRTWTISQGLIPLLELPQETVSRTYMNCSNAYCVFSFWLSATNSKCNVEMCMGNVVML